MFLFLERKGSEKNLNPLTGSARDGIVPPGDRPRSNNKTAPRLTPGGLLLLIHLRIIRPSHQIIQRNLIYVGNPN